jgi:hypothetical protein
VGDLRVLGEVALVIMATWLVLGWTFDRPITQADGSWLVVPYTESALHAGGDWTQHLYRFGVLGGSVMHPFGGTLPVVQLGAVLGLSTTATVNLVTVFLQVCFGFFGLRLAEAMATSWAGERRTLAPAQRVVGVWLIAFAPLLGWRLALGHENLLLGLLPLFVFVTLIWQERAGTGSPFALAFAAFAIANAVSGMGAQSLVYSAVFGLPLVVASMFPGGGLARVVPWRAVLVAAGGVLLVLPRLVPMIAHALGDDATRSVSTAVTTSYGAAPGRDWLTSIPWTIAGREFGGLHEHNYPLGPLALVLVFAWPRGASRRLLWAMLATLAVVMLFASEVGPVSSLLYDALPPLRGFRGPSRAALIVLAFVPCIAVAAWALREGDLDARSRTLVWASIVLGALAMLAWRGESTWVREPVAWLVCAVGVYLLRGRCAWRGRVPPAAVLALLGALGVLAFDERFPRWVASDPVEHGPSLLRAAVRSQAPELTTALDRVALLDRPQPYEMSTAFAARLPSIDGVWYPPRRFLDLLAAARGRPVPPMMSIYNLSGGPQFGLLQQLYNVRVAITGLGTEHAAIESLPEPPGAAWFPRHIAAIERPDEMFAALRAAPRLRDALAETAWVMRRDVPRIPEGCAAARVLDARTDTLGQAATFAIEAAAPCTLVVATNYARLLRAHGEDRNGRRRLEVFPVDVALTGIAVPAGTHTITLAPHVDIPAWTRLAQLLGLLALIAARWSGRRGRAGALGSP